MPSGLARIRVNYGTANSDRFAGRVTGGREIHLGDAREREMPQDGLPLCGIGDEQRGGPGAICLPVRQSKPDCH